MNLQRTVVAAVLSAVVLAVVLWLASRSTVLPPADSEQGTMADMPGMEKPRQGVGVRGEGGESSKEAKPLTPDASRLTSESGTV
ncbi:MAG: hypothetical protein HY444_06890, partial [Nitrospirae bacterium]|nr:hypothetical protein [Nitrospirota bacterium]